MNTNTEMTMKEIIYTCLYRMNDTRDILPWRRMEILTSKDVPSERRSSSELFTFCATQFGVQRFPFFFMKTDVTEGQHRCRTPDGVCQRFNNIHYRHSTDGTSDCIRDNMGAINTHEAQANLLQQEHRIIRIILSLSSCGVLCLPRSWG